MKKKHRTTARSQPVSTLLYKYRALANLEYALDILVHARMYASHFEKLNDPMEGSYSNSNGALTRMAISEIYDDKTRWRILSLSATPRDTLMWSYYAESHAGVVIGVELDHARAELQKVQYVKNVEVRSHNQDIAKQILCKKLSLWGHEQEYRVLVRDESFVRVRVKEVIFGIATPEKKRALFSTVAQKFCPAAKIRTLQRNELTTMSVQMSRPNRGPLAR